jgi:putative transposase
MPANNTIRVDEADSTYHIYARGVNRQNIFFSEDDYEFFVSLFDRYLGRRDTANMGIYGKYPSYRDNVALVSYCLLPNHFHLQMYQKDQYAISSLMKSIMTSFVKYINKKYSRSGPLFESRFKSKLISDDSHLLHLSRYIHLNRRRWKEYRHSSALYYINGNEPSWLDITKVLELFDSREDYISYVTEYEDRKRELDLEKADE